MRHIGVLQVGVGVATPALPFISLPSVRRSPSPQTSRRRRSCRHRRTRANCRPSPSACCGWSQAPSKDSLMKLQPPGLHVKLRASALEPVGAAAPPRIRRLQVNDAALQLIEAIRHRNRLLQVCLPRSTIRPLARPETVGAASRMLCGRRGPAGSRTRQRWCRALPPPGCALRRKTWTPAEASASATDAPARPPATTATHSGCVGAEKEQER